MARRPPDEALAPPRSQVTVVPLRGGSVPDQLLVAWQRELRIGRGLGADRLETEKGVLVWQASDRGDARRWRVVYSLRYPWTLSLGGPQLADVTGDGHPEALIVTDQGSGGCGVRRLIGRVGGRTRDLFRTADVCEVSAVLAGGALVVREPIGPCPYREASAHCFGGERRVEKRWNGTRFVTTRVSVRCALPRLDPKRGCRRKI